MKPDIVLVGAGNVASHLAKALEGRISAVVNRNGAHAKELAEKIGAAWSDNLSAVASFSPSVVLISVADNAIDDVVKEIGRIESNPLALHTSGSVPKESLAPVSPRTGVLYPLQTFSKDTAVNMSEVPFFTEAGNDDDYEVVDSIARHISPIVHHADAERRRKLHVAGVFSSNFTTALLEITQRVLAENGYPLSTVKPLVEATMAKVFAIGPHNALTGPAKRGDKAVMELQRESLPELEKDIYDKLSRYIIESHDVRLR